MATRFERVSNHVQQPVLFVSNPTVSFVVLSYNFGHFLGECIESILHQEGEHEFEIIIVDDESTDHTRSVLRRFNDPRLKLIEHERNVGHVASVNEALSLVRGRYVARIDGDDKYRSDFLNRVLPVFEAFPEVGLVYGDAAIMDEAGNITQDRSDCVHKSFDHKGNEFVGLLEENFISAPTIIARREAWEECLPVPDGLAFHDWYFTLLIARSHEFYYLAHVLADYRVHPGNHHSRIIRNMTEERSIFWMLDRMFSDVESSATVERSKQHARRRIYGHHYLTLADKYFGMGMNAEARRCYLRAIRNRAWYLFDFGVQRRLAATIIGRERYERGKTLFRGAAARN